MTRAPASLLALRSLLLTHLDNAPGPDDLDPAEVGIVGDPAHRGGYHCGSDRVVPNDYSVVESPRDRAGLTLDAAALDVGQFEVRDPLGRVHNLRTFSIWCVAQCAANAADTRDIREIIYSPDGVTVKRWDRLGKRTTGDGSHRWHTHFSLFRDAIKAGRDLRPLFRRYLQSIGLLEDDDMTPEERGWLEKTAKMADQFLNPGLGMKVSGTDTPLHQVLRHMAWPLLNGPNGSGAFVATWMTALAQQSGIDGDELAAITAAAHEGASDAATAALALLTPEKIAAAIPPTLAKQVADELTRRLAS